MIPIKDDAPISCVPYVTYALITANVLVFIYELTLGDTGVERFIYRTAAIPYEITHMVDFLPIGYLPPPLTLLTAMFVHGGILHVGGNMLFLWIFGDNIEDLLGHLWYFVFYVSTGFVASFAHIMLEPLSTMPMIGASGAVAGVLGAYFLLYPRAQVLTLIFLFIFVTVARVPAIFFLGLWFIIQLLGTSGSGDVAWLAHIGGFVAGALTITVFKAIKLVNGRTCD